jgi:hypothetical protein
MVDVVAAGDFAHRLTFIELPDSDLWVQIDKLRK